MNKYDALSDEELVEMAQKGDADVFDYLIKKYKKLVLKNASNMYILGAETEDLIQEGMIGLFKAARDYNPDKEAKFFTFADLCISRQIYTAVQASGRKKHAPLNTYISIYMQKGAEEDGNELIEEFVNALDLSPEDIILNQEKMEYLETVIETELSSMEKQALELTMTGMDYQEIAKLLGKTPKTIDNALTRAKGKIKKAMSNW